MPVQTIGISHAALTLPQRRMLPQTIAANSPIQNASTSQSTIAATLKMRQKKNSCGA